MKKVVALALMAALAMGCQKQKTGFVNTEKVVKEYKDMTSAQDKYSKMNDDLMAELQKKAQAYQAEVQEYQKNMNSMSSSARSKKEEELMKERQQLQQEQQMRSQQLQQESQAAIDSVIGKVKDQVKKYGEKNGYDYIYGQNDAGSIMYAKDSYDVTDEVIKALNGSVNKEDTTAEKPIKEEPTNESQKDSIE